MWEPRPLATLGASKACNRDIFTFYMALYPRRQDPSVTEENNIFDILRQIPDY
jgi:hypothetical protein